jgi:hypothetical protein
MRSSAVAFRGINQVISAYCNNDMASWSIWNGKEMMFRHPTDNMESGRNALRTILKELYEGGSEAQFSLRVYEGLSDTDKIKSNTPWDASFSFVLYGDEEYSPYQQGRKGYAREVDEQIVVLQKEIDELKLALAEAEAEEKPEGINGIISGIMEMPGIKQALAAKLVGIVNSVIPFGGGQPAAVAGLPAAAPGQPIPSLLDAAQQAKVQQAINVLCTLDAKLGDHLIKIAEIAVKNIKQYNGMVAML